MAKKKHNKGKGRPPKFVLDERGREVIGLSYNKANNTYYATFSDPRVYFSTCLGTALEEFRKWEKMHHMPPEYQEQVKLKEEIYKKAKELIANDDYMQEELENKARELLEEAKRYGRFSKLIDDLVEKSIRDSRFNEYRDLLEKKVKEAIAFGEFDKLIWERAYDLIMKDPIGAAKALSIKELAYLKTAYNPPLSCDLFWQIYDLFEDVERLLHSSKWYSAVRTKMQYYFDSEDNIGDITMQELDEALTFDDTFDRTWFMSEPFRQIPIMERMEILEDIFTTVKKAGYEQCEHVLSLLRRLAQKL